MIIRDRQAPVISSHGTLITCRQLLPAINDQSVEKTADKALALQEP